MKIKNMFYRNKPKKIAISLAILLLLFIGFSSVSAQFTPEVKYPEIGTKTITRATELPGYISYIFSLAIIIGVLIAVGSLIYGGFLYLSSTGAPEQMRAAKTRIFSALLGLVILLGSYLILNTVNPELTMIDIDKFEVDRGVRLIYTDSTGTQEKKITEISIPNVQEKYGDSFKPEELEIFGTALGELKAMAFSSTSYTGESTDWIEREENAPWPIQSIEVRSTSPGIYLLGEQEKEIFYLNRDIGNLDDIDNFNDKTKEIEIKNQIVGSEKHSDFAAFLFTDAHFKNELRIFIEKRDRDGDKQREDDEGNVPWDDPNTKENTAIADVPSSYPRNTYDGWGKVTGVSSAYVFQIGPEQNCKKVTLYKNPNFYDDPDDNNDVCEIPHPIYKPVDIEDTAACGNGWNDKAVSIELDGRCLVVLFEHDKCVPPLCATFHDLATGKHSEVFAVNDPDLSDNRINQCMGSSGVFKWGYQPCASAIAIYPIK